MTATFKLRAGGVGRALVAMLITAAAVWPSGCASVGANAGTEPFGPMASGDFAIDMTEGGHGGITLPSGSLWGYPRHVMVGYVALLPDETNLDFDYADGGVFEFGVRPPGEDPLGAALRVMDLRYYDDDFEEIWRSRAFLLMLGIGSPAGDDDIGGYVNLGVGLNRVEPAGGGSTTEAASAIVLGFNVCHDFARAGGPPAQFGAGLELGGFATRLLDRNLSGYTLIFSLYASF